MEHETSFPPTPWSLITKVKQQHLRRESDDAVKELCERYWKPIYVFLRKRGCSQHDAEEHTQSFFLHIISTKDRFFRDLDPQKGKLRSFLLKCLKNHQLKAIRYQKSEIRGGAVVHISIDDGEALYTETDEAATTPDAAFEYSWAADLLLTATKKIEEEMIATGRGAFFRAIKPTLSGAKVDYETVAIELSTTPGALRVATHRLRKDFRDVLKDEVRRTLPEEASKDEIEQEIQRLISALS